MHRFLLQELPAMEILEWIWTESIILLVMELQENADTDTTALKEIAKNIDAKKYEKIRYIASNGEQFCMWNVRMLDTRHGNAYYEWYEILK